VKTYRYFITGGQTGTVDAENIRAAAGKALGCTVEYLDGDNPAEFLARDGTGRAAKMWQREVGEVITAGGTSHRITPANAEYFELTELQGIVGGYIERIEMNLGCGHGVTECDHATMWANEDGKHLGLPRNARATELMHPGHMAGDYVAGTAIIVKTEGA
jgi:hypothetical protein